MTTFDKAADAAELEQVPEPGTGVWIQQTPQFSGIFYQSKNSKFNTWPLGELAGSQGAGQSATAG